MKKKNANDLIKESEKKFQASGIKQVKKGTGKKNRENKKKQSE